MRLSDRPEAQSRRAPVQRNRRSQQRRSDTGAPQDAEHGPAKIITILSRSVHEDSTNGDAAGLRLASYVAFHTGTGYGSHDFRSLRLPQL